uniref:NADH-ubiquinone oxidoreductase chain 3 n=1 Tax=Megalothorax incertus TaxID=2579793 RepID=A0A8E8GTT5_9HEXA|nr:NADH dehydrogenase subunit 3 [Megalothorax incertus]
MLYTSFLLILISMVFPIMNLLLATNFLPMREKPSPFECGFDPPNTARLPFSLQFFLIAVVFLVFDVEISLMLPMPIMSNLSPNLINLPLTFLFILILLGGLWYEWTGGALDWKF